MVRIIPVEEDWLNEFLIWLSSLLIKETILLVEFQILEHCSSSPECKTVALPVTEGHNID